MTEAQTAVVVTTIVLTGERLAEFFASHPGLLIGSALVMFTFLFIKATKNANQVRR